MDKIIALPKSEAFYARLTSLGKDEEIAFYKSLYFKLGEKEECFFNEMMRNMNAYDVTKTMKGDYDYHHVHSVYGPRECEFYKYGEYIKNPTLFITDTFASEDLCDVAEHSYKIDKEMNKTFFLSETQIEAIVSLIQSDEFIKSIKLEDVKSVEKMRDWGRDHCILDFIDFFSIFIVIKRDFFS